MSAIVILVLLVGLAVIGAGIAFFVALSRKGTQRMATQHEVIPGVPSAAPPEWAGAHTPEAGMHRRLRDAVAGLRAQAGSPGEDVELLELRVEVEQQAIAVDDRLIAAAALPPSVRAQALDEVERAVASVEEAAGAIAAQIASTGLGGDDRSLADLTGRVRVATQSRAQLDAMDWDQPDITGQPGEPTVDDVDEGGQPQPGTG
ncbi:MAG TPA: hypothetical protein VMM13_15050 [Euzebya sp.]|nr:hypothetical protein [Euzebya sp.]